MGIHTREAATYFLLDCLNRAPRPVAGWDRRVKGYVPLDGEDEINEYLTQFPTMGGR